MIGRERHLQEERLFDLYLTARGGEPIDPPMAEHLADCAACAARYAELSTFMDSLRDAGEAEADAVFTAERLRVQQHEIARRIAHVGRPARVISFPTRIVRRTIGASTSRTVPRWTAAAAAAGLFVGVAVGASYQWGAGTPGPGNLLARDSAVGRVLPAAARGSSVSDDAAFLSELEAAVERPHTRELQAFDALTPHFREIRDTR